MRREVYLGHVAHSISLWLACALSLSQVVCNTVTLAMDYYMIPDSTVNILSILNVVFSSVFLAEMVLKLVGE